MEIPTNLKNAVKEMKYKVWVCETDKCECVAVPVDANPTTNQPTNIITVCPVCITGFKLSVDEYKKTMVMKKEGE